MSDLKPMLDTLYETMEGNDIAEQYHDRHGIQSAGILTVYEDEKAALLAEHLRERIEGKVVIEIGGGIGLLGCYLAEYAKRVIVMEADPTWMSAFVFVLYQRKPKNLSYVFGAAEEFAGMIRGDVALFCTHSGHNAMNRAASLFAPEVIDVYAEIGFAGILGDRIVEPQP